ncbi:MAG: DEAD/DEAH box helicase family protein [Rickettsiales bacterium]|nr:DEAD/DEAH box helicase family protein [Rickettsiales bacterium]
MTTKSLLFLIKEDITAWRKENYKSEFSTVKEILNFQKIQSHNDSIERQYKYLRKAQFEAIETYLYLRFVKKTPKIIDLYKHYYPIPQDFTKALNINHIPEHSFKYIKNIDDVLADFQDENILKANKYHSLVETINLDYPSYILALAMGSGKTNIISAIIAIEFAIAIENEKNTEFNFMQNALVFAPGLTILKNSLKKISALPFEKILPPEMCRKFLANVKYIQAGNNKTLSLIRGSKWNIVVLNSEKIILREVKVKTDNQQKLLEERKLQANLRIEAIKSLPNLAIFSDEAHHTYGNKIGDDLKKVRETINHIHENKELVCVVNTTGTPYADKKMLKDVIFWYGLEDGIRDGILKSLHHGVKQYNFDTENEEKDVVFDIINNFFSKYKINEKIAFYFKNEDHLERLRPYIEQALFKEGLTNDIVLKYTLETKTTNTEQEFLSLDNSENKKRVILLIGMGKEGWDCKTLFATALITESSGSNNYILQASTRCLRQIAGNTKPATIYLSRKNMMVLSKEMRANYNTDVTILDNLKVENHKEQILTINKPNPPRLEIKVKESRIIEDKEKPFILKLEKPEIENKEIIVNTANLQNNQVQETGDYQRISNNDKISLLLASNIIATKYHLKNLEVLKELQKIYQENSEIPQYHLQELFKQIDKSKKNYKIIEEITTRIMAIIKTEEGFQKSEDGKYYFHTIRFKEGNSPIFKNNTNNSQYGFHYEPYNFDSKPEDDFFEKLLNITNSKAKDIEDIYFTGGLTTPDKTDFHFQYKGQDGKYHQYYPDFLIKKKNGEVFIVEIKSESEREDFNVKAKAKAVQEIANINENKIKYVVLYTNGETISTSDKDFLKINDFII